MPGRLPCGPETFSSGNRCQPEGAAGEAGCSPGLQISGRRILNFYHGSIAGCSRREIVRKHRCCRETPGLAGVRRSVSGLSAFRRCLPNLSVTACGGDTSPEGRQGRPSAAGITVALYAVSGSPERMQGLKGCRAALRAALHPASGLSAFHAATSEISGLSFRLSPSAAAWPLPPAQRTSRLRDLHGNTASARQADQRMPARRACCHSFKLWQHMQSLYFTNLRRPVIINTIFHICV